MLKAATTPKHFFRSDHTGGEFLSLCNVGHSGSVCWDRGDLRIMIEPRGSRRLSSQSPLDVRVSRKFSFGELVRIELLVDVLNVLNARAAEGLATDNLFSPNFGQPTVFMDPRRVMLGVRLNVGP